MSSVWVLLYYDGQNASKGQPTSVKKPKDVEESEWNIDALKEAVKEKMAEELMHCSAAALVVYTADTERPFSEPTSIRADKLLKDLIDELGKKNPRVSIDYDHPLIVVAPAPASHPPGQGKQLSCFGFFDSVIVEFIQIVLF